MIIKLNNFSGVYPRPHNVWTVWINVCYTAECGGTYSGMSGEITSWNYPSNYTNNLDCVYHIQVPAGYHVCLSIVDIDLGRNDRLTITNENRYLSGRAIYNIWHLFERLYKCKKSFKLWLFLYKQNISKLAMCLRYVNSLFLRLHVFHWKLLLKTLTSL